MKQETVLVTGATGPHGRAVVKALVDAGHTVRALTRDPHGERARDLASSGAEPVGGDLQDAGSLAAALDGVSVAYAVTTPFGAGPDAEVAQGEGIIEATRRTGLDWLILASVASADQHTGIPHFESKWRIEQRLAGSAVPHTVVAPSFFFENLGDPAEVAASGQLSLPLSSDRPLQQIALADLGAAVAAVIAVRDRWVGRRLELAADQPTPAQMADALGVDYYQSDLAEIAERSADLGAMYRFLQDVGYRVDIDTVRAELPDVRWTSFAQWAARRP